MKLATFKKGGVHPSDMKSLSNNQPITRFPLPEELVVSMSQHLGAPATLLKAVGDHVSMGEMIGQASSFISANVHSPVDGTVTAIKKVTMANSVTCDAVVIKPDEVQNDVFTERHDYSSLSKEELLAQIKEKGIVGLGGATFPAHVKMTISPGKSVENLVINGVECEPYLTADHRLMLEKPYEVLEGIMICRQILEPKNTIIGIEANKMDAVETLRKAIAEKGYPIQVMPLKMKYPQGDEKQLLKAVIDKEIPSGKLPIAIGAVVSNVGTVNAVYEAVALGKPLYERVVTVTGGGIKNPGNYLVKVGTKVGDLVEQCGGFTDDAVKLIMGGPMMGFTFSDLDTPVIKGTSGILVLSAKEAKKGQRTACLQCGRCLKACPIGLQPTKLFKKINSGKYAEALKLNLMDCKECGCCAFVCPANIPLVQGFRLGKRMAPKPPKKG